MIRKCPKHGYFRGEVCHCGDEGRYVLDTERTERMGRFISGALRHFPDDLGLAMDQHGWVSLDVLVDVMMTRYPWASANRLIGMVESDVKERYQIAGNSIRARYGHSINVDMDFPENDLEELFYGVSQEEADMIKEMGIKPIRQRYVHMSTTYEKALEAASVHTEDPVIFRIDAFTAMDDGIVMMKVNDLIVLSEEIPPMYIEVMKTG
ncbi:MAG: RNA 2'-phosphotransferase [Methanosarcinales archaeon]|nr:RNA 2'-phosphotransferase [ANME-2 cluster archaeon]MDF1531447.1 RNA 2'-phosphotransferase [ANME-2 cluster archaeon]MDW7776566.1 RNA 2'-phosphotransferase [Methanosarcinales archaeon]